MTAGWFDMDGRPGARTLADQMTGLEPLMNEVSGATVLDVGCAEGLIAIEIAKAGAHSVDAIDINAEQLQVGRSLAGSLPVYFECASADTYVPRRASYDIVLLLSILHKLKDPAIRARRFAVSARHLVVVRLPPAGPVIESKRATGVLYDTRAAIETAGFFLEREVQGPRGEWTGYFRRVK